MRESTRIVKQECEKLRGKINEYNNKATARNNVNIWKDGMKYIITKLNELNKIAETATAKAEINEVRYRVNKRDIDLVKWFV